MPVAALRQLTDDVNQCIAWFYYKPFYMNLGLMFNLCFGLPIVGLGAFMGGLPGLTGLLIVWGGIFYLILSVRTRKIRKAKEVYEFGREETIYYQGMDYNYNVKVNGAPQPVITISKQGEDIKIKSFNERVITAFQTPVQKAYVLDKYPEIILPETLFVMNMARPTSKSRSISI